MICVIVFCFSEAPSTGIGKSIDSEMGTKVIRIRQLSRKFGMAQFFFTGKGEIHPLPNVLQI